MNQPIGAKSPASLSLNWGTSRFGKWQIETYLDDRALVEVALAKQVHGGNVVGARELKYEAIEADGIVLDDEYKLRAGVVTADCVPVVVLAEHKAAVLHVSRKSIVRGLLENLLTHIPAQQIDRIWLGPHICEFHFKFEEERELLKQFRYKYPKAVHFHKGHIYLSLRKALLAQFDEWDVHRDKVEEDGRCTYEQVDLPSYRRNFDDKSSEELRHVRTVVGPY